jgi:hypothetical protein
MWFLHQRMLVTKDNLAKRNWDGSKSVVITIKMRQYDIFSSSVPLAKVVWRIVHISFNLSPPKNIMNLFGNWLAGVDRKRAYKSELVLLLFFGRYGMCAMIIFLTEPNKSLLCMHWICT